VSIDGLDDGFCGAIVRYVVFGGETGEAIVGGIAALGGCDNSGCKAAMICCLDEWAEIDICFGVVGLALSIVHVVRVDAGMREEVNNAHEQLLRRVGDLGNDGNFLAVGPMFE
jgi:hypothetical protein